MKKEISKNTFTPLLHPYQATLISTIGKDKKPNIIAIAWIIPISINPPAIAFAIRKSRHSFRLLMEVPEFVINIPKYEFAYEVMFAGSVSGKNREKIKELGLELEPSKYVSPPAIKGFPAHIECKVINILDLKLDHLLVIGEVQAAYAEEEYFKNRWDLNKMEALLHLGGPYFATTSKKINKVNISNK